jgi:hypothetical protein
VPWRSKHPLLIGNLRKCITYWESEGASEFVIDTIKHGNVVPFQNVPPPMKFKNNKSALNQADFVDDLIADLLKSGCIIDKSSGKKRLILELSELNRFIKYKKSKIRGLDRGLELFHSRLFSFFFLNLI